MFQNKRNVLNIYEIFVGGWNIEGIFWYKVWKQGCVCIGGWGNIGWSAVLLGWVFFRGKSSSIGLDRLAFVLGDRDCLGVSGGIVFLITEIFWLPIPW